jgi:hypothetical protein
MRNSWNVRLPAVCLGVALGIGWLLRPCWADGRPPVNREIEKLIAQLGSDSFAVRERATQQLKQREDAIPALRQALKSPDGEVARRAAAILDFFAQQEKKRAFARLAALAKNGQVDQAIETLVRHPQWDDEDACWQVLFELAGRLLDLEWKEFARVSLRWTQPGAGGHIGDFREYRDQLKDRLRVVAVSRLTLDLDKNLRGEGSLRFVVRAEEIEGGDDFGGSFVTSSGRVGRHRISRSVLFAGGSVELAGVSNSLIVCDGDFTATSIEDSLIIARGDVRPLIDVKDSRIITGGSVRPLVKRLLGEPAINSKVKEKETNPLGFVTFFDPAKVGIKVEKADGGLRVKEAGKDKPFARAGLRADDFVVAVDGDTVKDPEVFRRLLRAKLAVEGELLLKVRRGEQTLELRVPCKE